MGLLLRRAVAVATVLAGVALCAPVPVAHADDPWACAYSERIDVSVCVYAPFTEWPGPPLTAAGIESWTVAWAAYAQGYATALAGSAVWFTQNYQWYVPYLVSQCVGALNTSYRPEVGTSLIPDPLAVIPDVVIVPESNGPTLYHTWQCVDAGPVSVH